MNTEQNLREAIETTRQKYQNKLDSSAFRVGLATIALALSSFISIPSVAIYNGSRNPYVDTNIVSEYKMLTKREKDLKSRSENEKRAELEGWTDFGIESARKERERLEEQLIELEPKIESLESNPIYKSYEGWRDTHFTSDDYSCLAGAIGVPITSIFAGCLLSGGLRRRYERKRDAEIKELQGQLVQERKRILESAL